MSGAERGQWRRQPWVMACFLALATLAASAHAGLNAALHRPYTLDPPPNYELCTDQDDGRQMTDGIAASGNFWSQGATVGWQRRSPVSITVDLGQDTSIGGASFRAAAGKAGVEWPNAIYLFAGDDGKSFRPLGDLVALSNAEHGPPGPGYRVFVYQTTRVRGHGRFLRFLVEANGPFVFSDEVEVLTGPPEWIREPTGSTALTDPKAFFDRALLQRGVLAALRRDLALARARVGAAIVTRQQREEWAAELQLLSDQIDALPMADPTGFRAVLPMGRVHAAIFALIGEVDASAGQPPLAAWRGDPWTFLSPIDAAPNSGPSPPALSLLRGETRAAAVNVRNATAEATAVKVTVRGAQGPDPVTAAEVIWTERRDGIAIANALVDAAPDGDGFHLQVPGGMTRQIWLRIPAGALSAGDHTVIVTLAGSGRPPIDVPIPVRVHDIAFPAEPRLHVGGWDYSNSDSIYGVSMANVDALVAFLRSRHVDSPWATSAALPFGTLDGGGRMVADPDTLNFDRWVKRWPAARRYMVFVDVKNTIGPVSVAAGSFDAAVKSWLVFWAEHAAMLGVRPEQIHLLLVDEPHDDKGLARFLPWARAIRKAGTGIRIWEDPTFRDPRSIPSAFLENVDAVCVNRGLGVEAGHEFWHGAAALRRPDRTVEIYWGGPAFALDPYTYYRLQAWQAFAIGGDGISFWSFSDNGGTNPWNDFTGTQESYTPLFLTADSVTPAKQMEAIAESVHDFEILSLLRDAVGASAASASSPDMDAARTLLREGPARVLGALGADDYEWSTVKDRSVADSVRDQASRLLERLQRAKGSR